VILGHLRLPHSPAPTHNVRCGVSQRNDISLSGTVEHQNLQQNLVRPIQPLQIKPSDKRQRTAIEAFARRAGFTIVGEYYDAAVSGADPVDKRAGFAEMLQHLASNGAKTIIVESPDRFARDLAVQLAGHDMLKALGLSIIPASAPDFFTEETPTAVLVRQVSHRSIREGECCCETRSSSQAQTGSRGTVRGKKTAQGHQT
jgi:hypothetical protein